MGKKSDALREELDLVEAERQALVRQNTELQAKLDEAMVHASKALGVVIAQSGMSPDQLVRGQRIADADGVEIYSSADTASASDLQAIDELHRPPPPQGKVETSLDVVRANNRERASLQDSARRNNALISRVASALRVDRWDEDGTEILEKCQQWATFAHWIKQRQRLAAGPVANELGTVLAALVAPTDLARWIMDKTAEQVPECVVDVAEDRGPTDPRSVTKDHLLWIRNTCAFVVDQAYRGILLGPEPGAYRAAYSWLDDALKTERATRELLSLLNMVLVPFLSRLRVVSDIPVAR